ncbi:MAG: hypothetical protein OEZ65_01515 [Gemmatimonadota bacterium]|nr:hypothetical protein [Gemmatimonadota bacterium]MDH5758235.1 hypothetical protein [Gemmatimonadota bacterium]
MKMFLALVVGLAIGAGAGGAIQGMRLKDEIVAAREKMVADSLAAAEAEMEIAAMAAGDDHGAVQLPLGQEEPVADGVADGGHAEVEVSDTLSAGAESVGADEGVQVAEGTEPEAPAEEAAPAMNAEGTRRLAKIFAAMKPADASDVLAEMSDAEVSAVLLQLSERQAAQILGTFDSDRAAALSRVLLTGRGGR